MKSFLILLFILLSGCTSLFGQSPYDLVPRQNEDINITYLEHLIKTKIDSVRKGKGLAPLVNDSILYVAALHHADYMVENNRLTHNEELAETKTPQLRVIYYGAENYYVGENVLQTNAYTEVKSKKGSTHNTKIYEGLANSAVEGWVNSPGHYKNIITPEYQLTGLAVAEKDGKVYACQKFAQVLYTYEFSESKTFFPYSNYVPPPRAASFAGIDRKLINPYKYEWGLRHDREDRCASCDKIVQHKPYITLRYEKNSFILRVENSAYVEQLIQNKKDGFAVEIVTYDAYSCGNPAYYTEPSRRNGQLKTNGRILKPLFRKELIKGFKKRKLKKEVSFLSYLFGADSVKFKNRIGTYDRAKYDSEYFEINLGRLPKDVTGYWAHNLIYIQNNQICHIDYFTGYCGGFYMDTVAFDYLPFKGLASSYNFSDQRKRQNFEIPFEQGKSTYTQEDIAPFIKALENVEYKVDSVHIHASASIEGDSVSNERLMQQRASAILGVLQSYQEEKISASVTTEIAWKHFYREVRRRRKFRSLATADKATIINAIQANDSLARDLEPILSKSRKAKIDLFIRVEPSDANMEYLISYSLSTLTKKLTQENLSQEEKERHYASLDSLYATAYHKLKNGIIDIDYFAQLSFPKGYFQSISLTEKYFLYGNEFPTAFQKNDQWRTDLQKMVDVLANQPTTNLSPVFWYNYAYLKTRQMMEQQAYSREGIQEILDLLQPLPELYYDDTRAQENIEALSFNLNMLLLNTVFPENTMENANDAKIALKQVALYYEKNTPLEMERVVNMAKMAVQFNDAELAMLLTKPFMNEPEVISYILPLKYVHVSQTNSQVFYDYLIYMHDHVDADTWCNLFMRDCGIPFQAFDHEALRDLFCAECQGKNEFLNQF